MPVTINGDGSITGLSVGGLGSGVVNTATLANGAASGSKLTMPSGSIVQYVVVPAQNVNNRRSQNTESWYGTSIVASITPTNANNRIVIDSAFCCHCDNASAGGYLGWSNQAGGTDIDLQKTVMYGDSGSGWSTVPCKFQQIAGTTSQLNFELNIWRYNSNNFYIGWFSSLASSTTNQNGAYAHIYEVVV